MKKILFLSNGHGEDQTAAQIIKLLGAEFDISVYPLVGEGQEFRGLNVSLLGPRRALPGGGFSLRNFFSLPRDLASGLFTLFYSQVKKLKQLRGQFDLVVAIGDIVPIIGAILTNSPFIFIGVNKSDYYHSFGFNYTFWEKWLLKKYARKVFTRDEITVTNLKKYGIKAIYSGNPIMDGIGVMPDLIGHPALDSRFRGNDREGHNSIIGFLPGTRVDDIQKNIEDFEKIAIELKKLNKRLIFLIALKDETQLERNASFQIDSFENVIYNSDLIVGLSGTGNEQAAGIGKPLVAFVGRGAQYNKKFAKAQGQLLGAALSIVKRNPKRVAEEVWEILNDKSRMNYMGKTGMVHMGNPGAVKKIVEYIGTIL